MSISLYAGASGMHAQQTKLDNISNNLANTNTTGYKRSKIEFEDLLYQDQGSKGAETGSGSLRPTSVELGHGSRVVATSKIFTQGEISNTGEQMDIAIEGNGFLAIQKPDGTTAYTRDGALKKSADGSVTTSSGLLVLSGFQSIPTDAESISISNTGNVTIKTPGGNQNFNIELHRFANAAGLRSIGGNLYEETPASGTAEAGTPGENGYGKIQQGFLEVSNVDVVREMVEMIVAQRSYEISSKSIQAADEMLSKINQLKR